MLLYNKQGQSIQLKTIPLGKGGEGNIYQIETAEYRNYVGKIYHASESSEDRQAKLAYLLANKPVLKDPYSVIWVEDLLLNAQGDFAGFMMRKAQGQFDLTALSGLTLSHKMGMQWEDKFGRNTIQGMENRAKLCYNVAAAIQQIHQTQKYVLVDMKPENVKISLNGKVSIIDIDSMQVQDETQRVLFPAQKLTPEYSPAESQNLDFKSQFIPQSWDRFSMATVFYKVLFGLHPFTGTGSGEYGQLVSHSQKINAGLFPNGSRRADFQVIPKPHENFKALPPQTQKLFVRCFDEGFQNPDKRPDAAEWCRELQNIQLRPEFYQNPYTKPVQRRTYHQQSTPNSPNSAPKTTQTTAQSYKKPMSMSVLSFTIFMIFMFIGFVMMWNSSHRATYEYSEEMFEEPYDPYEEGSEIAVEEPEVSDNPYYLGNVEDEKYINSSITKIWRIDSQGYYKYGFKTNDNSILIPMIYDNVSEFLHGKAILVNDEKYSMIDDSGNFVIPEDEYAYIRIGDGYNNFLVRTHLDDYVTLDINLNCISNCERDTREYSSEASSTEENTTISVSPKENSIYNHTVGD